MGKVTIFVFTRHQKGLRFFAACFEKFWQNLCRFVIYSGIFISFFNLPINYITFVLFHGFRAHCKHKFFSYDDSRLCCLLLYIFTILHFPLIFSLRSPALEGERKHLQAPVVILRAAPNCKFEFAVKTGQSNHSWGLFTSCEMPHLLTCVYISICKRQTFQHWTTSEIWHLNCVKPNKNSRNEVSRLCNCSLWVVYRSCISK